MRNIETLTADQRRHLVHIYASLRECIPDEVEWICSHDTGHMWEASSPQPVLTWFMRLQKEF